MDDRRQELVEELFRRAADLPEAQREAFLEEHCGADDDLRRAVEALLDDRSRATASIVERKEAEAPECAERPGTTIGHYKILEQIGEGGFAVVYLAEQTAPVRRRVALKLIKPGMDTREVIARFEAERQALAMMDHVCVARVFDAGATDAGRPYFVMEYVGGVPITEHCDRHRLNIEDRLKLFMQLCDGVQHAHQKGIIHRDLKPTNVLVTISDGTAVPKVIDFGVAKALHQRLTERTMFTERGQFIGTPTYMSPEQAEMTAQDIDTRSDIYSLGVLLYELLTGALPFDPRALRRAAIDEIRRVIREEEPRRPSTRLSTLGDAKTASAGRRRAEPRTLVRALRGDLDWITIRALEKDRTRRYATASELAADLRRHLEHLPVAASPPSAAYRTRKFVRRHKVGVAAASTVALALVVGAAATTWQAVRATRAEAQALQRQEEAERQGEIARAVNEFLNDDLLAAVAPSAEAGKGRDVLMRDVLDEAAKRIDEASAAGGRFEDKPLVEASIRETLGETYRQLGQYAAAEPHLVRARELRRRALGEGHPGTLQAVNILAALYMSQGRYEQAEPLLLETIEISKRALGSEHPGTLASMHNVAALYQSQGRYEEAEPLCLETLEIHKRVLGAEHPDTLMSMRNLAILYARQGRDDEAEPLYLEALEIWKRVSGEDHPGALDAMNNLANLYARQGRDDEAEPLYVQSLETRRRVLGAEHPDTVGSMNNLALLYLNQGRYEAAEPLCLRTLEINKRVLGADHPDTLKSMHNLALLYERRGRYEEAEGLYLETLEIRRRVLGAEHPRTLMSMNNLAGLYWNQGRYDKAEPLCRETLQIQKRTLGAEHPDTLASMHNLAGLYQSLGRAEEAERLFLESLEMQRRVLGDEHPDTLSSLHALAGLYVEQGRYGKAEPLNRELIKTLERVHGAEHPDTLETIKTLADLYDAWGKPEKAAEWRAKLPAPASQDAVAKD